MNIEETSSRLIITRDQRFMFLLVTLVIEGVLLFIIVARGLHPWWIAVILLAPLALISALPYSYTITVDKEMGKIVCLRRALLYKRRKEVQLDELQSVDVGYSIWEGMSKVVASVDSAEIGLLTLPEDEAEEVIEQINEFLGEKESEYSTPTEAVAEESLCSRLIKFARDAYLIIVGSVVIISSFFAEVLPSLGAMSPLAAVGTVMFFVGALYEYLEIFLNVF